MMSICLTITLFLWILQSGRALECYQTKETCFLNYSKNDVCSVECYKLSHICLIDVPNSTLSENTIPAIVDQLNITRLDIAGNISSILDTSKPPLNAFKSLNIIGSDSEKLFISNTTATTLTISKCKIKQLILLRQDNLKTITLSGGELEEFPNGNLASLPKAELLDLSTNRIVIFGETFEDQFNGSAMVLNPNMKHLNLSYNQILELNKESFQSMPRLQVLDLSHNRVQNLTAEPFSMTTNLIELYLCYNRIEQISVNTFDNLLSLATLHLDHNSLMFLFNGIFRDLKNLVALDLSFNRLFSVEPQPLFPLTKLSALNLESNRLKEIDFKVITGNLRSITFFNIKDNQLSCRNLEDQFIPKSVTQYSRGNCLNKGNYSGICCYEDAPKITGDPDILYKVLGGILTVVVCIFCGFWIAISYKMYKLRRINDLPMRRIRVNYEEHAV